MDAVLGLKQNYNKVLERWNRATTYLESPIRTLDEVEMWLPEYEKILKQRLALCLEIRELSGARPILQEFENGFDLKGEDI